jgi:hypothetical protein
VTKEPLPFRIDVPIIPKPFKAMTVIPWRSPVQKAHSSMGYAKAAINARVYSSGYGGGGAACDMQVFELVDNEWKLLWDIPKGTKKQDLPWNKA